MTATPDAEYPSPAMRQTLDDCRNAARTHSIVLLLGESGSGKDYLAREIHNQSERSGGPFFGINCAAIPPELAESELFGHEAGAFTGANSRKKGLIELSQDGTLLLNEIGEMSPILQAKLLSFLDTNRFMRVGGVSEIHVDTRIIAATNRDLEQFVLKNRFRADLFCRLNVMQIHVPPLRERRQDIPILVNKLLSDLKDKMGPQYASQLNDAAVRLLVHHSWPGNVRELRNVLERALIRNYGNPVIDARMIISVMSKNGCETNISKTENNSVEVSDEQFKRMIEEVFGDAPTPVAVLCEVLGWKRKEASAAVKRVGCSGKSGRIPKAGKEKMISALRQRLQEDGIL